MTFHVLIQLSLSPTLPGSLLSVQVPGFRNRQSESHPGGECYIHHILLHLYPVNYFTLDSNTCGRYFNHYEDHLLQNLMVPGALLLC